ncbi:hypothetical protein ES703_45031 [subsurface metagenome]
MSSITMATGILLLAIIAFSAIPWKWIITILIFLLAILRKLLPNSHKNH